MNLATYPTAGIIADTITPFVFLTAFRLIIANFIIAFIESLILRLFFKVRRRSLFGWMLLANAISAVVGAMLLTLLEPLATAVFSPMIFHFRGFILAMFVLALVISFVLEFPFVRAAAGPKSPGWGRSLLACAAAQIGSYTLLLPLYLLFYFYPIQSNPDAVLTKSLDFVKNKSAVIVFLSADGPSVNQIRLDGSPERPLVEINGSQWRNLSVRKADDDGGWDLWATTRWNDGGTNPEPDNQLLKKNIAARFPHFDEEGDQMNAVDWRLPSQRQWKVDAESEAEAPSLGLKAVNEVTGKKFQIRVCTIFAPWIERCPNILPGDQVVFEISGQIVVLDLNTRQLGFVCYGYSPIVISPSSAEVPTTTESRR